MQSLLLFTLYLHKVALSESFRHLIMIEQKQKNDVEYRKPLVMDHRLFNLCPNFGELWKRKKWKTSYTKWAEKKQELLHLTKKKFKKFFFQDSTSTRIKLRSFNFHMFHLFVSQKSKRNSNPTKLFISSLSKNFFIEPKKSRILILTHRVN